MDDVYSSLGSLMFINIPGSDGVPGIFCSLLNVQWSTSSMLCTGLRKIHGKAIKALWRFN
ncbi:hypothetical protein Ahy_A03g010173 isoform B [Arachis hypogaea]|uniref:Uncharacterized protein n=1 Tax=Arachis hypogaea TaxID=3818 RepID=A0A445DLA7_ARAHY|nr:hypothetical protein Ahy_A03g010173 isoform B [Arachis hypogaea]